MNADLWVDPRVAQVNAAGLESYLLARGWKRVDHPRKQLMVFEGPLDDDGEPFLIVVPSSERFRDFLGGLVRAIETLSIIEDRRPVAVLNDLLNENPRPTPSASARKGPTAQSAPA